MQTIIVILIIILSVAYLISLAVKSGRSKKGGGCSNCGKE